MNNLQIIQGDNREVMKTFADNTFSAIVTDPPYELGFMGKKWDSSGIAYDPAVWKEALRVLKPGGHLLSFGGSRTYHRMACAIEDAGFEIRDMIEWIYGSGFPKSLDVSKAIDKSRGAKRRVIGRRDVGPDIRGDNYKRDGGDRMIAEITEAETAEAKRWAGWGTALKPAHEPICMARKPFNGTVVENVLQHGTGAINLDACRIGTEENCSRKRVLVKDTAAPFGKGAAMGGNGHQDGRFPANLILDPVAAEALDRQSGQLTSGKPCGSKRAANQIFGRYQNKDFPLTGFGDTGGASRFFYTAKASGTDRGNETKSALPLFGVEEEEFRDTHPTVKPIALMIYLLKLVCPPGAHVLDPFLGSGTTAVACKQLGIDCTGIELEAEHITIIKERISR